MAVFCLHLLRFGFFISTLTITAGQKFLTKIFKQKQNLKETSGVRFQNIALIFCGDLHSGNMDRYKFTNTNEIPCLYVGKKKQAEN